MTAAFAHRFVFFGNSMSICASDLSYTTLVFYCVLVLPSSLVWRRY